MSANKTKGRLKFYFREMRYFDRLANEFLGIEKLAMYYAEIADAYAEKVESILKRRSEKRRLKNIDRAETIDPQ